MGGAAGGMSSRRHREPLSRTTAILAGAGFFLTSLFLSWHAGYNRAPSSIIGAPASRPSRPSARSAPPTSGGILDSLKKADEQQQNQARQPASNT